MPTTFELAVERYAQKVGIQTRVVVKKLAFQLFDGIVIRTPVDTGRARASWTMNPDRADLSVQPKSFLNPDGAGNVAAGQKSKFESQRGLPERIVIANNLPYIGALENGWSKQAPSGMVKIAVAEVIAGIRSGIQ